jgi:hypothetical protein
MSLSYTWKIDSLKVKDEENTQGATLPKAVYQTYWTITGTNSSGQSGTWSGATPFSAKNVPEGSFVAFADLTEETVLGWVKNVVNSDAGYKAHIDEQIIKRIEEQFGTAEDVGAEALPWATGEVTPTPPPVEVEAPAEEEEE